MKNKVLKNVVLLACILGVVLFPLNSYAQEFYTFSDRSSFNSAFNNVITFTENTHTSQLFVDFSNIDNRFQQMYDNLLNNYDISDTSDFVIADCIITSSSYSMVIYCFNKYPVSGYVYNLTSNTPSIRMNFSDNNSGYYQLIVSYSINNGTYSYQKTNPSTLSNMYTTASFGNRTNFCGFIPFHLTVSPTNTYEDYYTLDPNNNGSGGNGGNNEYTFESITMNKPPSAYTALSQAFMQAAINRAANQFPSVYNGDTSQLIIDDYNLFALGELIANNTAVFESYTIHSYDFYDNVSENLANGMTAITSSMSNLQEIADRLSVAFPDDQAEINDSIAETLLDDTNDTGLTAEKVSNAKSDFDDGISTYEIDTSGSAYSTPFAAIRGGDWSFWSQTTLDNMGSGYSYTYQQTRNTKASNDSDIYEENSKSLFNLLGW